MLAINESENVARRAGEIEGPLRNQKHWLGRMQAATGCKAWNGIRIHVS